MLNVNMVIVKVICAINDDAFMRVFFMLNFVMLGVVKDLSRIERVYYGRFLVYRFTMTTVFNAVVLTKN